jgi:hypothetical protein
MSDNAIYWLAFGIPVVLAIALLHYWKTGPCKGRSFGFFVRFCCNFPAWFFYRAFNTSKWREYVHEQNSARSMELRQAANDPSIPQKHEDGDHVS